MHNQTNYKDFIEKLKIEFGDFLRYAEAGKTVRYSALIARNRSMKLREILKEFRVHSLKNDKRIANILREAKTKIDMEK